MIEIWGGGGLILFGIGFLISIGEPINKKLWSVSFAFATSGVTGIALTICFVLVDVWNNKIVKNICI